MVYAHMLPNKQPSFEIGPRVFLGCGHHQEYSVQPKLVEILRWMGVVRMLKMNSTEIAVGDVFVFISDGNTWPNIYKMLLEHS